MDNKYLTRSNFLESVVVDNFRKMRLEKMGVIRMESRQRTKSEKLKVAYMKRIKQTLVPRTKKITLKYLKFRRTSLDLGDRENCR